MKQLKSFVRSPTWIAPQFVGQIAKEGRGTEYTEEEKAHFRNNPEELRQYRQDIDHTLNSRFPNFYKNSVAQKATREAVEKGMRERLANMDPALREKLIPDFDVGCRRSVTPSRGLRLWLTSTSVTPGEGYLEALQKDNVEVITNPIASINQHGLVTKDSTTYPVDVIITATGYDTSYVPPFPLIGRNGVDLGKRWTATGAEAYFTCAVPSMPNYFSMISSPLLGPQLLMMPQWWSVPIPPSRMDR